VLVFPILGVVWLVLLRLLALDLELRRVHQQESASVAAALSEGQRAHTAWLLMTVLLSRDICQRRQLSSHAMQAADEGPGRQVALLATVHVLASSNMLGWDHHRVAAAANATASATACSQAC
jgi:hypothetical protein